MTYVASFVPEAGLLGFCLPAKEQRDFAALNRRARLLLLAEPQKK